MTRAGFEPALPKETVLETVALDHSANESKPPAGLEPAIYRLEVCRLIHWATGALCLFRGLSLVCWIRTSDRRKIDTTTIPRSTN